MATPTLPTRLGGRRARLARHGQLGKFGKLGNVHGPDGGFDDSPLGGSMLETEENVSLVQESQSIAISKTPAAAPVAPVEPVFNPSPGGGAGDGGVGGGAGDGGAAGDGDGGGAAGDAPGDAGGGVSGAF